MFSADRLPEFSLVGKIILVSGGARGLGLTQAEALLEAGATGKKNLFLFFPALSLLHILFCRPAC
jgi:hypothetical protein